MKIYKSVFDLVGNTPLLELTNFEQKIASAAKIYAKVEFFNPAGSVKDRVAREMIEKYEKEGKLTKNSTLIEATSGNTGIGLAAIGSSIAFIVKSLQNISILNIITVLCGILLVFGGPVVIVSLIKLYKRDLGRFLEASGCALNFPMRLSRRLGNFFTMAPKRPVASWIGKKKLLAEAEAFQRKRLSLVFLIVLVLILLTVGVTLHLLNHGLLPR